MSNFALILVCLFIGFLFRKFKLVAKDAYKTINSWVIYVGLPSVALRFIPQIEWKLDYIFTAALPLAVFSASYLSFNLLNRFLKFSNRTKNTLILVSGLSNTSFVGFPLVISFFGEEQLKIAIVSDQVTFFTLSTLGVLLATSSSSIFNSDSEKYQYIIKRIITFPPLIACIIAIIFSQILIADTFQNFFAAFAATVSPLALFSIGMQLNFQKISKEISAISLGLGLKLIIAPLLCIAIAYTLNFTGTFYHVSIFEMAMPCLVATSMVIEKFKLNTKLANTTIGLSIIIGLVLSFLWNSVIVTLL